MFHSHGIALKPSLVLIEKWIASNEVQENNNENLSHVVDNISSETNKELSHNGERSVTGESSLPETFENNEDGKTVPENQQVTYDSALVLGINKIPKLSKSKHKSKKKDRHNRRSKNDLQSRVSSYLTDDTFSDQRDNTVAQMNDEQVQGSSENLWRNISISDNIEEKRSKRIMPTATVTSHSLEESQAFYEEIVVEETPLNLSTDKNKTKQISGENGRWSHSFDKAADFNGHFTGVKTDNVYRNYLDMIDNIQQNDHRSNSEYAEMQDKLSQPQFELVDDVDDDQPIDYSMSMSYHHQVRTDLDFTRKNFTIRRTESTCLVSPAGFTHTGFANNGFSPYLARSNRDNQKRATQSDLHHPVAQKAFEWPSLSQYPHGSNSVATNGVAEHSSGTKVETVDASSQTEIESVADHPCDGKCYIKCLDNNNELILKMFNCCFSTMAVMANGAILNCSSPSFAERSSQIQPQNTTSLSENRSNLRLENDYYHEDNAHPEETQVANIRRGRRNKNDKKKRGIPQKQSQRLLDMARKNGKVSQNADEVEVVPPKKSKKGVNQEFEVENENVCNSSSTDNNSLEAAARKISVSRISVSMETTTMTPIEPIFPITPKFKSTYIKNRKIKRI
ncbi:uncharacterized protein LOC119068154 isoform X3 [Bradysia coprophila]|uniref:uncharacterized protein LOC119068154 isoform X3 n=1 Tax=Bradysia coprophila TaxID=38358 RepID=UPI00187DAEAC|nr:uncharacterized protein LOC119068154 isoform X3 [Bradysia coprophila]